MSRIFTDRDLLTWEAYASTGAFGLPDRPKVVFNCLSHQDRRARYVVSEGDRSEAEGALGEMSDDGLRELLAQSRELG
jgi:hypothetical protein